MVDATQLPPFVETTINGVIESVPVYGTEDEVPDTYAGHLVIPSDNIDPGKWSSTDVGGGHMKATQTVQVVKSVGHPTTTWNGAEYYLKAVPEEAQVMIGPILLAFLYVIIAVVIITVFYLAMWTAMRFHAIDKSTELSTEPVDPEDPNNPWYVVCKGQTCYFLNKDTGETKEGPIGPPINGDVGSALVKYAVIFGGVLVGGILFFKGALPALESHFAKT